MANVDVNEIARKLKLTVEQVSKSPSIQNTYLEIKNNPNMSESEKDDAFAEMSDIIKGLVKK
ncbi:hypothetical protein NSA47_06000 [Irregularibacter muris]|uniref:Uncharacterized protein n=1 Tax=Irregularibacter muris TaxID=1796619 RepID=A0AAE3HG86_9FIRM|nr:hypothetical protein [Irregularibacter muris]MCR1898543.1 hypothetical protein [Irregularibacter muris]